MLQNVECDSILSSAPPLDDIAFLVFFLLHRLLTSRRVSSVFRIPAPRGDSASKEHAQ